MEAEIVQQLVWIKWLLCLQVVLALVFIVIMSFILFLRAKMQIEAQKDKMWETLLRFGDYKQAIKLAQEHLAKEPNNGYALWALARAYHREGVYDQAIEAAERLRELEPTWDENYTLPLLKVLKRDRDAATTASDAPEEPGSN